jgi:bacterioferritin
MNKQNVIEALNEAIALEHAASMQYKQQSLLVRGLWRPVYAKKFADAATEAMGHAAKFGQKVVALGGVPTVEIAPFQQAIALEEMLRHDLDVERKALSAYQRALELAAGDTALCTMIEDQIEAETQDVEDLELILEQVQTAAPQREVSLRNAS